MNEQEASAIIRRVAMKNKSFRVIQTRVHENGVNVLFADLPKTSMTTIADWIYAAGGIPLYVGREFRINGFVMVVEIK